MDVLRDLGHVSAVSSLVKHDVDLVERGADRFTIAHVALHEFHVIRYPRGFSPAMRLRFKVIKDSDAPSFTHEQVCDVRTNQASTAGDECAFCHASVVGALAAASKQ